MNTDTNSFHTGPMEMASDVLRQASKNGGWTMDIHSADDPDHGYSVGGNPDVPEWIIPGWRNTPGPVLIQTVTDYLHNIDRAGQSISGGWESEGTLYLDAPTILESRSQAIALGRSRGEQAIYCLHTGETIEL